MEKWIETTLRKGTKSPKICRDMFVIDNLSRLELVIVKNGKVFCRQVLTVSEALKYKRVNKLEGVRLIFTGRKTYRTKKSNSLIAQLLNANQEQSK